MLTSAPVRGLPTYRNERYCGRRRRDRHAEPHHQDLPGQRLPSPADRARGEARAPTRLYLITPPALDPDRFAKDLEAALAGGDVACLQLRLKDAGDDEIRRATRILQPIAQERGAAFIMNDRLQDRSEEHTSELQSHSDLVCRLLLEKKKKMDKLDAAGNTTMALTKRY